MNKRSSTVFIVDDDQKIRDALQWLFELIELEVICFSSASAFLDQYDARQQGCLIVDVRMPGMSGLELLEQLKLQKSRLPIIVITGHGDIPMAVRAMKAGAMDFILKPFNDQYLLEQIQKALNQPMALTDTTQDHQISVRFATLTARERDIMNFVINGKLNKQIAHELGIALSTVELHRGRVMQKMQAKNLAQLIKFHLSLG